jgi:hypothetical protein
MSLYGSLSRHLNLDEIAQVRQYPSFQSVATRQAKARANLGLGAGTLVAGTAVPNTAMVTDANNGIGGSWRDTRITQLEQQTAPAALNATGTLTAANMLTGLVTSSTAAAVTATLDTGTLFETALIAAFPGLQNGDSVDFSIVNTGPNAFTIATAAGWTDGGNAFVAVATATSARFVARRTAANTYTLYKMA